MAAVGPFPVVRTWLNPSYGPACRPVVAVDSLTVMDGVSRSLSWRRPVVRWFSVQADYLGSWDCGQVECLMMRPREHGHYLLAAVVCGVAVALLMA